LTGLIKLFWGKSFFQLSNSNDNVKKNYSVRIIFSALILFWCLGIISQLFIPEIHKYSLPVKLLNYNYSLVCHQNEMKSFVADGSKFLVCARCTGIYFGSLLSSIAVIFISYLYFQNLLPLMSASILLLLDIILTSLGVYNYSKEISFITGILFGAILYIYILEVLEKFFSSNRLTQTNET